MSTVHRGLNLWLFCIFQPPMDIELKSEKFVLWHFVWPRRFWIFISVQLFNCDYVYFLFDLSLIRLPGLKTANLGSAKICICNAANFLCFLNAIVWIVHWVVIFANSNLWSSNLIAAFLCSKLVQRCKSNASFANSKASSRKQLLKLCAVVGTLRCIAAPSRAKVTWTGRMFQLSVLSRMIGVSKTARSIRSIRLYHSF